MLEGGEGNKDGSSNQDGVFPLSTRNDLDLDGSLSVHFQQGPNCAGQSGLLHMSGMQLEGH